MLKTLLTSEVAADIFFLFAMLMRPLRDNPQVRAELVPVDWHHKYLGTIGTALAYVFSAGWKQLLLVIAFQAIGWDDSLQHTVQAATDRPWHSPLRRVYDVAYARWAWLRRLTTILDGLFRSPAAKATTLGLLLPLLLVVSGAGQTPRCGTERWSVKTLTDGVPLNARVANATVGQLRGLLAPHPLPATRAALERQAYTVRAVLIGWKLEADQDLHIVIADSVTPEQTMIAEIPSPACTQRTPAHYRARIIAARAEAIRELGEPRASFETFSVPVPATLTGVAFFDVLHGQSGVAPNGIELHPVLDLAFP